MHFQHGEMEDCLSLEIKYIEIRKYADLAKSDKGNHLYLANNEEVKYIDCSNIKLPYFRNLINDVVNRTETAAHRINLSFNGTCNKSTIS